MTLSLTHSVTDEVTHLLISATSESNDYNDFNDYNDYNGYNDYIDQMFSNYIFPELN